MTRRLTIEKGPADQYAMPGEAIWEFSDGQSGGLLSMRRDNGTGHLTLDVYRADHDVRVRTSEDNQWEPCPHDASTGTATEGVWRCDGCGLLLDTRDGQHRTVNDAGLLTKLDRWETNLRANLAHDEREGRSGETLAGIKGQITMLQAVREQVLS